MKFSRNTTYYEQPTHEFNLPAGWTCPMAKDCKVIVSKEGKFERTGDRFSCYAAKSERFPSVRLSRWRNYNSILDGDKITIPRGATHVRIHASGDFFGQWYFDNWLETCRKNSKVLFWAFTKSISFWVKRINEIPDNLKLTASVGGHEDNLIKEHNLIYAQVFDSVIDVPPWLPIDCNDRWAIKNTRPFALIKT